MARTPHNVPQLSLSEARKRKGINELSGSTAEAFNHSSWCRNQSLPWSKGPPTPPQLPQAASKGNRWCRQRKLSLRLNHAFNLQVSIRQRPNLLGSRLAPHIPRLLRAESFGLLSSHDHEPGKQQHKTQLGGERVRGLKSLFLPTEYLV